MNSEFVWFESFISPQFFLHSFIIFHEPNIFRINKMHIILCTLHTAYAPHTDHDKRKRKFIFYVQDTWLEKLAAFKEYKWHSFRWNRPLFIKKKNWTKRNERMKWVLLCINGNSFPANSNFLQILFIQKKKRKKIPEILGTEQEYSNENNKKIRFPTNCVKLNKHWFSSKMSNRLFIPFASHNTKNWRNHTSHIAHVTKIL